MWFARLPNASEQKALFPTGTMYRDMPVGTKIFLRYFFVDRLDGKSGNPDFNRYMMVFDIPETVPKHSIRVYCMGDDCTLAPLPWNMNIPWPEGKRFNPEDIEHLFPGGTWE
ncbi:hypothetical protein SDC9_171817 [bioreactor metagenome]|uniref:Uncharacterized protein n=1 Tax=bioreactor metagenome TaxID=1076179 RepID=A0A645GBW9_9ZZZZ